MQAVVLEGIGEPEQLVLRELPAPVPEDGQVVVEVKAVAINFLEILVRRGLYPQMPELPWIPGTEIAGVTEDGRRVIGLVRSSGGGYAERAAVDEQWLFDLPAEASSCPTRPAGWWSRREDGVEPRASPACWTPCCRSSC